MNKPVKSHSNDKKAVIFDLLRLDHFRAFADYWQIAACEETAVNGRWVKGPGRDLLDAVFKYEEYPRHAFASSSPKISATPRCSAVGLGPGR